LCEMPAKNTKVTRPDTFPRIVNVTGVAGIPTPVVFLLAFARMFRAELRPSVRFYRRLPCKPPAPTSAVNDGALDRHSIHATHPSVSHFACIWPL
jgi:hypothetical protein